MSSMGPRGEEVRTRWYRARRKVSITKPRRSAGTTAMICSVKSLRLSVWSAYSTCSSRRTWAGNTGWGGGGSSSRTLGGECRKGETRASAAPSHEHEGVRYRGEGGLGVASLLVSRGLRRSSTGHSAIPRRHGAGDRAQELDAVGASHDRSRRLEAAVGTDTCPASHNPCMQRVNRTAPRV